MLQMEQLHDDCFFLKSLTHLIKMFPLQCNVKMHLLAMFITTEQMLTSEYKKKVQITKMKL